MQGRDLLVSSHNANDCKIFTSKGESQRKMIWEIVVFNNIL